MYDVSVYPFFLIELCEISLQAHFDVSATAEKCACNEISFNQFSLFKNSLEYMKNAFTNFIYRKKSSKKPLFFEYWI